MQVQVAVCVAGRGAVGIAEAVNTNIQCVVRPLFNMQETLRLSQTSKSEAWREKKHKLHVHIAPDHFPATTDCEGFIYIF